MYNIPAEWPEGWELPQGVVDAEERAREARIIEERRQHNARVLAEADKRLPYVPVVNPATCPHDEISVFQSVTQEDHETTFGACHACGAWVVSTLYLSNDAPAETRVMTAGELDQFRVLEDRRRHDEWLAESRNINESPSYRDAMNDAGRGGLLP